MFKKILLLSGLALATGTFTTSCNNADTANKTPGEKIEDGAQEMGEGVKDAANNTVDGTRDATNDVSDDVRRERDEITVRVDTRLRDLDREIEQAEMKAKNATAAERERWDRRAKNLREYRNELDADLKELRGDMKGEWNEFKAGVNRTLDNIDRELSGGN